MTPDKVNYHQSFETPGPCFDQYKSPSQKAGDFVGKNTFLEKRNMHKEHVKEDFYKKRLEVEEHKQETSYS